MKRPGKPKLLPCGIPPEVTRVGVFDMQVCVPKEWTDAQAVEFANSANPCGTHAGWGVRKEGSKFLKGDPERVPCKDRKGMVHIVLDA